MTENDITDITSALRDLAESVAENRVGIVREISTLAANVGTLQASHDKNAGKLDRVLELELTCPARGGWDSMKGQVSQNRVAIESVDRVLRGDATGQTDVANQLQMRRSTDTRGNLFRTLALKALPYVLLAGVALGAYLVSGGDEEAMTRALRAVSDAVARVDSKIEKVEAKVDDVADVTAPAVGVGQ